ncbi:MULTISPECIES: aspartate-alanine antiporter [unclassified Shewanella]|uniref:aspartate-alanine antiporter n=1 Tax=unclassified Shewanella TaxID=196818 RepID=UPI000C819D3A|nr:MULTISPECIES: aspartate-alanine antiporter [unclassified Shewanella]MDO6676981.1 aspartate-alanine antiporter [Shewanella sp. 4_MG-2023]MDO6774032.1 aspartate-alanine antiporter [Shewanella sp. 3_MG-2023]PMG27607.1 aspartate-alanine antiporter [Shewanella sp. 10N.286.52.C2]PMG43327.1 aspartate-alanine antiporter [Shewanella sp. 10N.286.52.B9]PMH86638.1 aspartate-alanine antiporter [Shewanella sp. 10N.286.48.B5]
MNIIQNLFAISPYIALFITLALGYLIGKITIGRFVLGGIAGTLLMGVLIGQFGVQIDPGVKTIFFALFIYAVGYQGGPQFFGALNFKTINILLSAVVMTVTGLITVLVAAKLFSLDSGTAAGLAAGGLTQSAIIGTAGDAISQLGGMTEEAKSLMQTNVAVGYAVTYIFGSLGPILMVSWLIPTFMKWDIREEALKLAEKMSDGKPELAPGEFNAMTDLVSRAYKIPTDSRLIGQDIQTVNGDLLDTAIEMISRDGQNIEVDKSVVIKAGDILVVTGLRQAIAGHIESAKHEVALPRGTVLIEENRQLVANDKQLIGKTLAQIKAETNVDTLRGVYVTDVIRGGNSQNISADFIVHKNDIIQVTGSAKDINRIEKGIGKRLVSLFSTDYVLFGLGMVGGLLIGLINFEIAGIPVTIGSGAGCLISGLFVGWLRSRKPNMGSLPLGASNFLRDFGLAVFVGVVGLQAGPQAIDMVKENGLTLLFLGVAVTIIPQIISFFISYYVLKIKNPIEALACVAGGRSANPGFAALLEKAGNATPVFAFTVTYAIANVLLTLWGPIIVGIISTQ